MKLRFLFLPFIGYREHGVFKNISPRFDMKHVREPEGCMQCIYAYIRYETNVKRAGDTYTRIVDEIVHWHCSKGLGFSHVKTTPHPCKKFTHPYKLKKL